MQDGSQSNHQRNRLLASMMCADLARLQPYLKSVQLKFREQLENPNRKIKSAYFIESGIASVIAGGRGRNSAAEVGIVGREGMTGLAIVLGAERSPYETFIQGEGEAQRIDADDLRRVMSESDSLARFSFAMSTFSWSRPATRLSPMRRARWRNAWRVGC